MSSAAGADLPGYASCFQHFSLINAMNLTCRAWHTAPYNDRSAISSSEKCGNGQLDELSAHTPRQHDLQAETSQHEWQFFISKLSTMWLQVIMSDQLWHCSGPNQSLHYRRAWMPQFSARPITSEQTGVPLAFAVPLATAL